VRKVRIRSGAPDGWAPNGTLVFDSVGSLYGTTEVGGGTGCGGTGGGTVFEIAPDSTETILSRFNRSGDPAGPDGGVVLKTLYSFACADDGANPAAGLLYENGRLFGTTESGGNSHGNGTVFVIQ
jgi:uncharacterized repeat protein (TIGR03803 family)